MIQRERLQQISFFLFYAGLILLVVSMPLSKFGMSVSQFMIAFGWLISGDLLSKLKKFFTSKVALAIVSVYVLHILGLIYTTDFAYAVKDLRIKLPLLILPLLLATGPRLSSRQFEKVLIAVITGVTVSTFISFMIYAGVIKRPVVDIRDISIFISHIRLALLCCISIFIAIWLIYQHFREVNFRKYILLLTMVIIWLLYFLVLIQSITGIIIIVSVLFISLLYFIFTKGNSIIKIASVSVLMILLLLTVFKIQAVLHTFQIKENISAIDLQAKTLSGNDYVHYTDRNQYENGYPVWAYICESEMITEWNKRSELDYNAKDLRNQDLQFTLIRFLTSKGLKKDSAGVAGLSAEEVAAIENGIANIEYVDSDPLTARLHQIVWELNNMKMGGNPSGHSFAQRFEYWKAAILIVCDNPVLGVGTGDVLTAFSRQYDNMNSPLTTEWRLRSHNQYLSIAVAFGIPGLIWFLLVLCYLLIISVKRRDFLYFVFAITAMMSMLTEDTLETQAGITFFTLFACLFLFVNPRNQPVGGNTGQPRQL